MLETLRTKLNEKGSGDTENFFQIVNTFKIRHNKESTNEIEFEAQYEFVFYIGLNLIITYYKIINN